ncbi:MAG: hypothetical protein R8L53_06335 [Mariprofundales bacterium]
MYSIQIEKLSCQLIKVTAVIDLYAKNDVSFPFAALKWIEDAEKLMASLRLPDSAQLAILRGKLLAIEDSCNDSDGRKLPRSEIRRAMGAQSAAVLEDGTALLQHRRQLAQDKIDHFSTKLEEAMTAAALSSIIPIPETEPRQAWLELVWRQLAAFQATRPTAVYVSTSLIAIDRLYILDQILTRMMSKQLPVM